MGVFVLTDAQTLVPMQPASFVTENDFQELLARFPEAAFRCPQPPPRCWLLIRREMPVPAEDGGGGRWSVDHLFIDQDGVPTLVEVKRQNDTRTSPRGRRADAHYAANAGGVLADTTELRDEFVKECATKGKGAWRGDSDRLGFEGEDALFQAIKAKSAGRQNSHAFCGGPNTAGAEDGSSNS